jgi:hypothetical protein
LGAGLGAGFGAGAGVFAAGAPPAGLLTVPLPDLASGAIGLPVTLSYNIFAPAPSTAPVAAFTSVLVNELPPPPPPPPIEAVGLTLALADVVFVVAVGAAILEAILGVAEAFLDGIAFSEGLILIAFLAAGLP